MMSVNQKLAAAAATLATLALLAGGGTSDSQHQTFPRAESQLGALELAEWIRAQKEGLRIVDVRAAQEYEQFHIPRAQHVALDRIGELSLRVGETVVLYSEDDTQVMQAWSVLEAKGVGDLFVLRGGLHAWLDNVMSPPLTADARTRELSAYFGGRPAASGGATLEQKVQRIQRRGC